MNSFGRFCFALCGFIVFVFVVLTVLFFTVPEVKTWVQGLVNSTTTELPDDDKEQVGDVVDVIEVTDSSITVTALEGYEYSLDNEFWQDSNVFTDLISNTEYTIYYRLAATESTEAGEVKSLVVTTLVTTLPYNLSLMGDTWTIKAYTGNDTSVTLPDSFSFGPDVEIDLIFADPMEFMEWQDFYKAVVSLQNGADNSFWADEHAEDEILDLTFIDANDVEYDVVKFSDFWGDINSAEFPLTATITLPAIVEGDDYVITTVEFVSDNVYDINLPAGITSVSWTNLGKNVVNVNIDPESSYAGSVVFTDGMYLTYSSNMYTLSGIMEWRMGDMTSASDNTLVIPSNNGGFLVSRVNSISSEEFFPMLQHIERVVFEEGITSVNQRFLEDIGREHLTVEYPSTLQELTGTDSRLVYFRDINDSGVYMQGDYKYDIGTRTSVDVIYQSAPLSSVTNEFAYDLGYGISDENAGIVSFYVYDSIYDTFMSTVNVPSKMESRIFLFSTYS